MHLRLLSALACSLAPAIAQPASQVAASWHAAVDSWQSGTSVKTAIRLQINKPWHIYWINPGEGGMETKIKVDPPAGWTASAPGFPVPVRFKTGDLEGFGYEGEVWFPIVFTPTRTAQSAANFTAEISWLSCNEDACVPGSAHLKLHLPSNDRPRPTAEAAAIAIALQRVPIPASKPILTISGQNDKIILNLTKPNHWNPADAQFFPLTPSVIEPQARIRFRPENGGFVASVARSTYATRPLTGFSLVAEGGSLSTPVILDWKKK